MKLPPSVLNRLYDLFKARAEEVGDYDLWLGYLDHHGIKHGHTDDLIEVYSDDPDGFARHVLVRCPANVVGYLMIPLDMADKIIMLGLPRS